MRGTGMRRIGTLFGRRVIAAFLIAPAIVPIVTATSLMLDTGSVGGALIAVVFSAAPAYAAMGVIGLPAYLLLPKRGPWSFVIAVIVGCLAGIVAAFTIMVLLDHDGGTWRGTILFVVSLRSNWIGTIIPAGFGILVGALFWFIARPDRLNASSAAGGKR